MLKPDLEESWNFALLLWKNDAIEF